MVSVVVLLWAARLIVNRRQLSLTLSDFEGLASLPSLLAEGGKSSENRLEEALLSRLTELDVRSREIETKLFLEDSTKSIAAAVPRGRPMEWVVWHLSQSVKGTSYSVADSFYDALRKEYTILFTSSKRGTAEIMLTVSEANRYSSSAARMAILVNGFDFRADQTTVKLLTFPKRLTISIIPDRKNAAWAAQAASEYGKEVVIALPLESHGAVPDKLADDLIMIHFPEERIRRMIIEPTKIIPHFAGFCNLFGSRGCEDSRLMRILLQEVHGRKAYFVDTRAARNSVAPKIAAQIGLPFAQVSAEIDEKEDAATIEEHIQRLCVVAQKKGGVLVYVPASVALIEALQKSLERFEQNGIELVFVSQIVQTAEKN
jgi:polysaccharide deacetylase 2 family uncharacterized protein YibQ